MDAAPVPTLKPSAPVPTLKPTGPTFKPSLKPRYRIFIDNYNFSVDYELLSYPLSKISCRSFYLSGPSPKPTFKPSAKPSTKPTLRPTSKK